MYTPTYNTPGVGTLSRQCPAESRSRAKIIADLEEYILWRLEGCSVRHRDSPDLHTEKVLQSLL